MTTSQTRRVPSMLALALLPLAIAGCTATEKPAEPAAAPQSASAAAKDCLSIATIRESRVIDDQTIDFITTGGKIYRNTLPHKCSSLGFEKAFTYATSLSQLCSTDIITVLHSTGGSMMRGASCGLGKFVPYTPPPKTEQK